MREQAPKDELLEKLKAMSLEDLQSYKKTIDSFNNAVNAIGILLILFMLFNPTTGPLIICGFIVLFLASTGANIGKFRTHVKKLIEAKDK